MKAADFLYQTGTLDTSQLMKLPIMADGILEIYKSALPTFPCLLTTTAIKALRKAVKPEKDIEIISKKTDIVDLLSSIISIGFKTVSAADTGMGEPIFDPNPRGEFTSQITDLINMAIGDEVHAISFYNAMINALEENDPNVVILEELKFDEQVHERVLVRMQGNEKEILENAPPEPKESKSNPEYDKLKDQGKFLTIFNDLIHNALGDERHAIALYSTLLDAIAPDDPNQPAINQLLNDEIDHEKKLLGMLGEKIPEQGN